MIIQEEGSEKESEQIESLTAESLNLPMMTNVGVCKTNSIILFTWLIKPLHPSILMPYYCEKLVVNVVLCMITLVRLVFCI